MNEQPAIRLSAPERDALTEAVTAGLRRAEPSLRLLASAEVVLAVPAVEILTAARAAELTGARESGNLVAVHQSCGGDLSGGALLIFSETDGLKLVRAITGGDLPLEDIIALEQEALAETGNIILNASLATIAGMLRRTLRISLPEVMHGTSGDIFRRAAAPGLDNAILFLYINCFIRGRDIQGYIALLLDLPPPRALKDLIQELVSGASGESPS